MITVNRRKQILIVDLNLDSNVNMMAMFDKYGLDCDLAFGANEALAKIKAQLAGVSSGLLYKLIFIGENNLLDHNQHLIASIKGLLDNHGVD